MNGTGSCGPTRGPRPYARVLHTAPAPALLDGRRGRPLLDDKLISLSRLVLLWVRGINASQLFVWRAGRLAPKGWSAALVWRRTASGAGIRPGQGGRGAGSNGAPRGRSLIADLDASTIFDQILSFILPRRRLSSAATASAHAAARRRRQDWPPSSVLLPRVMVLYAVGKYRRNIRSEAQTLQVHNELTPKGGAAQRPPSQPPTPSPRGATRYVAPKQRTGSVDRIRRRRPVWPS